MHQTLGRGEIYLTDDNNAVALWDFERNEKMSFHYIWRNVTANAVLPQLTNTLGTAPQSEEQKRTTWEQQAVKRMGVKAVPS